MSAAEHDTELLETMLDGELPADEQAALEVRLRADAALAARFAELKSQRSLRLSAFDSGAFDQASIDRLIAGVRAVQASEAIARSRWPIARRASVAAACLLVGLAFGSMVKVNGTGGVANQAGFFMPMPETATVGVSNPVDAPIESYGPPVVVVRNNEGRIIARFRFSSHEEAKRFAEQLRNWASGQKQPADDVKVLCEPF